MLLKYRRSSLYDFVFWVWRLVLKFRTVNLRALRSTEKLLLPLLKNSQSYAAERRETVNNNNNNTVINVNKELHIQNKSFKGCQVFTFYEKHCKSLQSLKIKRNNAVFFFSSFPASWLTAKRGGAPVNGNALVAAAVGVCCHAGAETLTVASSAAGACVGEAVHVEPGNIHLSRKEKTNTLQRFIKNKNDSLI